MTDGHRLSIIIVTYNSAGVLPACLDALAAYPPSCPCEVLVVDNGSTDATLDVIRAAGERVIHVPNAGNLGFARGNALGVTRASGDLLLLLNPDTEVTAGALDALMHALAAEERRWVAGACLLAPDGTPATSWGDFPGLGWAFANLAPWRRLGLPVRSRVRLDRTCAGIRDITPVDWVSGAAFLIRRSAWHEFGGLHTGFFLYFEETDLCWRVREAGGQVVLTPQARIIHNEGASVGQLSARQRLWLADGFFRYLRRTHGRAQAVLARAYVAVVNALLLLAATLLAPFSRAARRDWPRYAATVRLALGILRGHPGTW